VGNAEAKIDYLVDNISNAAANIDGVKSVAHEVSNTMAENAIPAVALDVSKDAGQSTGEQTDPYSISTKVVETSQEASPVPSV
jgi:hypothetical protein